MSHITLTTSKTKKLFSATHLSKNHDHFDSWGVLVAQHVVHERGAGVPGGSREGARGQQAAWGSVCSGVRLREAHRRCGAFVGVGAHGGSRDALGIMGSWLGG